MLTSRYSVWCAALLFTLTACGPEPSENNANNGTTNNATTNNGGSSNNPPIAEAGENQVAEVGQLVQLSAAASSDPDNDILTVSWEMTDVPSGSQATLDSSGFNATFTPDFEGQYTIVVTVSDGDLEATDTVYVRADPPGANSAPVANAGDDATLPIGTAITLDGSGSSDPDGDDLTFAWALTGVPDGSSAAITNETSERASLTPDLAGAYTATLVVNDGRVDSEPDTVVFNVLPETNGNTPPVADAGPDTAGAVGDTFTFNGVFSSDADGDPLTYSWTISTKPAASAATLADATTPMAALTPDVPGLYEVALVVNDGQVDSVPAYAKVTVNGDGANRPTADAGTNRTVAIGSTVTLDGSRSSDPDGDPLTYRWLLEDRPMGSNASLNGATNERPTLVPDVAGPYTISLKVNDGTFDSIPSIVVLTAREGGAAGVIISEYVEGPSNDKAIEIYNTASSPIDLSGIGLCIATNDMRECNIDIGNFPGVMLAAGDTYVVCANNISDNSRCDTTSTTMSYNGNDRIALFEDFNQNGDWDQGEFILDAFGEIAATVSGSEWEDSTYRRCDFTPYDGTGPFPINALYEPDAGSGILDDLGVAPTTPCGANRSPAASISAPSQIATGSVVNLDGSGSSDPDGDPLTYAWTLTPPAGSAATLDDATSATPSFTADVDGVYDLELVVNDGMLDSATATRSVRAGTIMPGSTCLLISEVVESNSLNKAFELYNCGASDVDLTTVGVCIAANGASDCSSDTILVGLLPAGDVYTICHTQISSAYDSKCDLKNMPVSNFNGDDRLAVFTDDDVSGDFSNGDTILDAFGDLTDEPAGNPWENAVYERCDLTARDGRGPHDPDTQSFARRDAAEDATDFTNFGVAPNLSGCTNMPPNGAPSADVSAPSSAMTGMSVSVDGSGSSDPDGDPITYSWTLMAPAGSTAAFDDATSATPSFTPDVDGSYTVSLIVSDGTLSSNSTSATIIASAMGGVDVNTCTGLIISEYVEGSSSNKALEIHNCGAADVDLTSVGVCVMNNTSNTCTTTYDLMGTLSAGGVLVLCHPSLDQGLQNASACDELTNTLGFNGNDRIALLDDDDGSAGLDPDTDTLFDIFGVLSGRPSGDPWADKTYRRKCDPAPFDGSGSSFPVDTLFDASTRNDLSGLGTAPADACP